MVRCPETGRAISTGIKMDRTRFNSMPVFFARSYCPLCRTDHAWFARDAWVCDEAVEKPADGGLTHEPEAPERVLARGWAWRASSTAVAEDL